MNECIFCKMVEKKIPVEIVDEDEDILAFKDIKPQAPIHVLVIPKIHIPSITSITKEHSRIMMKIIKSIQNIAKKTDIIDSGFRIVVNNGENAGQAVDHLHFHILGGRSLKWPPG
ncbi:histidine triad nucleotide-binding protein [candidate division WOR-1 bacterium RIFOXYC2_FULL_37_10]|uniref:Histidine triad nucleotide-binding protein n=1 Tax=candidate division WOR-1 bacterium RIFOXYB2_FULL_37_13 TaxID=1802579 RepID=A0A1F4SMP6_UNCSA|nr:MAG: histidine triad nucleotide-binding protein [candidate division WOR-1 bacterium RIFOXYA2_FULL_37_7]OGC21711.1 MAG: histidine triad nucleotide-binding protein [candidate division WOR-1 bacterium RIFOXYB2_FULL_37_13]OGC32574.1 MAG: histidine triad nucleotide-binding protein [candidate division WOR-1 bacterium RIFOXYC2_FULL_37_10]